MMRAALVWLCLALPASAQQTAADILSQLDGVEAELRQLNDILTGPNEERALAAMRLMLASGDPALERMALRAGLSSTSGVARGVALEAYLSAMPTVVAFATAQSDNPDGFRNWIEGVGSVSSDATGSFPIEVGPITEDGSCYGTRKYPRNCYVRIGGTEVSFLIGGSWGSARLNENGELVGAISNGTYRTGPIALRIPLLGQLQ